MRALAASVIVLLLAFAGCIREDEVAPAALIDDEEPPIEQPPSQSAPPSPTPPPPSSQEPVPTSTSTQAPPPEPETAPAPPPRIEVLTWTGRLTAAGPPPSPTLGGLCCQQAQVAGENVAAPFEVPLLRGLVVELVHASAEFDLDLVLEAPDYNATPAPPETSSGHRWMAAEGAPGAPDPRARIFLTEADALALVGSWTWRVVADGPANDVAFTVLVSLHHDAPPAEDYTAAP